MCYSCVKKCKKVISYLPQILPHPVYYNIIYITGLFLYSLKASESLWFYQGVERGKWYEMGEVKINYFFQDEDPYHIVTSSLICRANQWTGFYIIEISVMKQLKLIQRNQRNSKIKPPYSSCRSLNWLLQFKCNYQKTSEFESRSIKNLVRGQYSFN